MDDAAHVDVLVHGAGAIGLYIGGRLAASGLRVHFVGRERIVDAIRANGVHATTLECRTLLAAPGRVSASTAVAGAPRPRLVLLTVKGTGTAAAAAELAAALPAGTPVLSFQNGVDNLARLRAAAPALDAIAGMVPFNVVQPAPAVVRQTTSGVLAAQRTPVTEQWQSAFAAAGLPLALHRDMRAVQWGKLLLNLNNPINALAAIPLREQLLDRGYRRVLAAVQQEALLAMRAAGIRPARVTPLPSRWLPALLRLPTPVFEKLARRMLTIAPDARSSMYDDRVQGRPTEIDDLCGAVVRLAREHGRDAPRNRRLQELVQAMPQDGATGSAQLCMQLGIEGAR